MRALISVVSSTLSLTKPASRQLRAAGIVLLVSAAIHVMVLLAEGGQWAGPVSLRKPITFGLSVGLLLWTVGWVIDRLPSRRRLEGVVAWTLIGSGLFEVALITVQAWRGVPSHFNFSTGIDTAVFAAMGVSISFLSAALLAATVLVFLSPPADPALRLAVRAGLLVVLVGLSVGGWMIGLGNAYYEKTEHVPDPLRSGDAGVPTFVHAMAFHGIQLFIVTAILVGLAGLEARAAQRIVRLVVAGYSLLVLWAGLQAVVGVAPFDLAGPATALLGLALGLFAAAAVLLVRGWRSADRSAHSDVESAPAVPSAV